MSNTEFDGEICKLRINNIVIEIIGSPKNKLSDMWGEKNLRKKLLLRLKVVKYPAFLQFNNIKHILCLDALKKLI